MLTGILAAENFSKGTDHDVWAVNVEENYHETDGAGESAHGDALVPGAAPPETLEDWMYQAFARYDPVALGGAIGTLAGLGLFLATAVLLVRGGTPLGPNLSLLGNYLLGYSVSWPGAWIGLLEAGSFGAAFGYALGHLLNLVVGIERRALERRIDALRAMNPFGGEGG